jgi:CRP-like cAMP-binding protein
MKVPVMDEAVRSIGKSAEQSPAHALEINLHASGDLILEEGNESPFFFVILSGQVRLSRGGTKIRILSEQDIFGLESLILRKPSYYTVIAVDKCRIAKYGPEALDHLIRESPRMVQSLLMSTVHQLTQTTYFLLDPVGRFTLDDARVSFFDDGDLVLDQNSRGVDFYRLVSTQGGLRVTIAGKEIARFEKPGEFFGKSAGLFNIPKDASITSIGESVVETYCIDDLDLIIRDHPDVARQMMRALISCLAKAERKLTGIGPGEDTADSGE